MLTAGFVLLPLALVALLLTAARRVLPPPRFLRFALMVAAWLVVVGAAAGSGALARFDARPPPFALLFLACVGAAVALAFSQVGTALGGLPLWTLIAFQGFRLPLEVAMHEAAAQGVMPPQMTWTGLNLDVLSGASALVVAALLRAGIGGRALALGWSLAGSVLLAIILAVAVASTPVVHAFGTDAAHLNTFVAHLPYTSLPAVMVVLALAGHLVLFRVLLARGAEATTLTAARARSASAARSDRDQPARVTS